MNDKELGKKEAEQQDLESFLVAYSHVTGLGMEIVARRERPDFEVRCGKSVLGLELVQVRESPDVRQARVLFGDRVGMSVAAASDTIQEAIHDKEKKRASNEWAYRDSTILVVNLKDCSGRDVFEYWDDQILSELSGTGFIEIWLCDHGPEDAYGAAELVGVKPVQWRGVHPHLGRGGKPFG